MKNFIQTSFFIHIQHQSIVGSLKTQPTIYRIIEIKLFDCCTYVIVDLNPNSRIPIQKLISHFYLFNDRSQNGAITINLFWFVGVALVRSSVPIFQSTSNTVQAVAVSFNLYPSLNINIQMDVCMIYVS